MKKRILSLLLAFLMIVTLLPSSVYAEEAEKAVTVWYFDSSTETLAEAENVELYRGGELYLSAVLRDGISGTLQWQIEAEQDFWVDIQGGTTEDLRVSYGMVKSLLTNDIVRMRCAVSSGDDLLYSDPVTVSVTDVDNRILASTFSTDQDPTAPEPLSAPEAANVELADEDIAIYTITIEYVYANDSKFKGQRVALPYIAEVAEGKSLDEVITSPNCVGYVPDISSIDLSALGEINGNHSYTVNYSPAEVSYTVRHYQQNIDDDEYTWVDTTMATGKTESLTSDDAANTYTGFTELSHYHEEIAADSSTMIDIYYDRNYYLVSFDLDGGYGVEPVYARYGASIQVGTPYKPGYTFTGWDMDVSATMPAENKTYTAKWEANEGIPYTVAYWLEDPDNPGTYDFWTSMQTSGTAGDPVNGSAHKTLPSGVSEELKKYSYYDHADENVTIKGDGSTVVNVYYNRNEYTLKFYYAARETTDGSDVYKIFGGSTYYFGASNSNNYNGDEMELLNAIYKDRSTAWGEITAAPELNSNGSGRGYTTGADTKNSVDYLYLSFKAKYGADISRLWPCNVFQEATRKNTDNQSGWTGTAAYVSAWNGEHHVYYSLHNGNQTIKGNYTKLDYQLLFDNCGTHTYDDSSTVAYLCFWENGSGGVNWNVPELYVYNIYVPVLDGMDTSALSMKTYNGETYYLLDTYETVDDSNVGSQTPPAMSGYSCIRKQEGDAITDFDTTKYREAYNVDFFYERETYDLVFMNGSDKISEVVEFGADISGKAPADLEYHDASLKDLYVFDGWYTTAEAIPGTKFDLTDATMPDSALTLYAKWNLITHDVNVYLTEGDAEQGTNQIGTTISVTHNEAVPEELRPDETTLTNGDETFIGWFYKNENDEEQAFDFATMTITHGMTIYAKWRSNLMKQVEVHYVVEDEDGNRTQIADVETLMLRVGQTRTFEAKTGPSLYEEYRTGYFPTVASHSVTPEAKDLESDDPVTWTFVYKHYGSVPYNVEFYVQESDGTLRPAYKNVDGKAVFVSVSDYEKDSSFTAYVEEHGENDKAIVTELYIPDNLADETWSLPDDYIPSALKLQRVIVPGENNEYNDANTIQFIYTYEESAQTGLYSVNHYIQNPEKTDQYDLYSYHESFGTVGDTVSDSSVSIPGYVYNDAVTKAKMQSGNTLTVADGIGTMSGIVVSADTLELNFYYTVNSYPYQVMYLEKDTNRVLMPTKTTDENGDVLTGLYGSKVTAEAEEIEGYDVSGADHKAIYIQMEAGDTAGVNTIVFYYTRKSADLVISKTVTLDEEQAAEEGISELPDFALTQEFTFTITCPTGFHKSVYDYTIMDSDNSQTTGKITAGTTTMTLTLKHGQTIAIHDLAMGSYNITETYEPGFRTFVDGTIRQSYSVTLEKADQTVTADFQNAYPFYTGDLVVRKNVVKLASTDPNATKPYKVTVTLKPNDAAREMDREITWTDGDGTLRSYTVPALTGSAADKREFTFDVLVPVNGEVKLAGTPEGTFTVEEKTEGTGYITDYYKVTYAKALHKNDEVKGTNHIVNGEVHGGHPTAVTYTNTYKKGDLTIHKVVTQEYVNDNWQSDTFTFQISGTTELPDGEYVVENAKVTVADGVVTVKDANGNDPTITINKTEDETSWSGSLTFADLPAGTYTVSENISDKYISDPVSGVVSDLKIGDSDASADFTNTYKRTTGNLQVGKKIVIVTEGTSIDTDQEFTFEVTLNDTKLKNSFNCVIKDTNNTEDTADDTVVTGSAATLSADANGKLTFKLKHNQYILIQGLPVGEYLVKELAVDGYDSSFGDVSDGSQYSVDPAVITTNETTVLNCQNAYPVYYSNLIVSKTVVTPDDHLESDKAPEDDVFTFAVTISDYSDRIDLSNGVAATFYEDADDTEGTEKALTVTDDVLTFQLKHGEWVDLNLPACKYTIKETGMTSTVHTTGGLEDHYTVSYQVGDHAGVDGRTYALVSGEREEVRFTNTYKRHYGELTITTICADDNENFIFDVTAADTELGDISLQVVLVGNDFQTITDLPVGTYTVTEKNEWSWRENAVSTQSVELKDQNVTVPFDFETVDRIFWLSGYSYNIRKGDS